MTQNINGIDQDNDFQDMICPRLSIYCKHFDKCKIKLLPEAEERCFPQAINQQSPPNKPMPDDPRDIQTHELFNRVINLEAKVEDIRRELRGDKHSELKYENVNPILTSIQKDVLADRIYLTLWENPGYLPDPLSDAFRDSVIKTAIEVCHETADEDSYVKFCAETIRDWMKNDKVKDLISKPISV